MNLYMSINFENILKDYITNLLIKYDYNILNHFEKNTKFVNMSIKKTNDLYIIHVNKISDNLIHSDKLINEIIHNLDYCIFNRTMDFIIINKKKIILDKPYTNSIINEIKNNWKQLNIYENIGINTYIFNYNDQIYFYDIYDENIHDINNDKLILSNFLKLNINLQNKQFLNVSIIINKYNHLLYYKNNDIIEEIKINFNKHIHYSCFDELIFDLENISKSNENKKKISHNGIIIQFNDNLYILNTYIYQKISDMMIPVRNINKAYLELYKNDNLSFIINYISPYPHEIIKRINNSIKTLSREFLNIYHITRKKLNAELYNILSNNYKTILFDLHKIFIVVRKNEENIENSDDFFYIKKSMNHDIIYKYLKKININLLTEIYIERLDLINNLSTIKIDVDNMKFGTNEFKILFNDCINTKTMGFLLKI